MKEYSAFPKAPALLEPYHQIASCDIQDAHCGGSYPSVELQSMYSIAAADLARERYEPSYPSSHGLSCTILGEWLGIKITSKV